jgi:hypothetical protein
MVAGSLLDFDWTAAIMGQTTKKSLRLGNETNLAELLPELLTSGRILDGDEVRALLRAAVEREGNQVAFARRHGLDRAHLNMILSGKRGLSDKVIAMLSLRKVYTAAK